MKKERRSRRRPCLKFSERPVPLLGPVPVENVPFPAEMAGFLISSRPVPVYPGFSIILSPYNERKKKDISFDSKNAKARQQKMRVLSGLQKQVRKYREQRLSIYEQYSNGGVSKSDYLAQKKALNERLSATEEQIALLEDQLLQAEQFHVRSSDIDRAADTFANENNLTYEMAHAFIEAIHVFPDGRREIVWKFKDIAELLSKT